MTRTLDLSGEWEFSFKEPIYDDTMNLPGTTAMAGKGEESHNHVTGYLTEKYPFCGKAFFRRKIALPSIKSNQKVFLSLERTRISRIFIDGSEVGTKNSLTVPHVYDITEYIKPETGSVTIELEISNTGYPTSGGHMTSPDTQTNWIGVMGRMELHICDRTYIQQMKTIPDIERELITLLLQTSTTDYQTVKVEVHKLYLENLIVCGHKNYDVAPENLKLCDEPAGTYFFDNKDEMLIPVSELWSEHNPVIYRFDVRLLSGNARAAGDGRAMDDELDCRSTYTALREFKTDTHYFCINNIRTKLRGKHDALLFPLTGAAPMELSEWLRVMGISMNMGINHYRYHTCCPPEAAFLAADLLGIYVEPELPFWGTIAAPGEEQYDKEMQEYLIKEGKLILDSYANHASFVMFSPGNELWGSRERIAEIIDILKKHDDRPLYTQGSNNFQFVPEVLPKEDFFVGARLSGNNPDGTNNRLIRASFATCDMPLGANQTMKPTMSFDFDAAIIGNLSSELSENEADAEHDDNVIGIQYNTGVKYVRLDNKKNGVEATLPIVSHEIGQYSMYPDFNEIKSYTGVLEAGNFMLYRDIAKNCGLSEQEMHRFFEASGKFATDCYKAELEMMHKSRYMAGYQLLDIQDYTGQGTSIVGVLNSFMENKGLVSPQKWRTFCSDEVIMASFDKFTYTEGETFKCKIVADIYNPNTNIAGREVTLSLRASVPPMGHAAAADCVVATACEIYRDSFVIDGNSVEIPGNSVLGSFEFSIPKINCPSAMVTLRVEIAQTTMYNEYTIWIYKEMPSCRAAIKAYRAADGPTAKANQAAMTCQVTNDRVPAYDLFLAGKKVILFNTPKKYIPGFYCADFWNYSMFRQISENLGRTVPVGTLGLCISTEHPALDGFACRSYTTPQWYDIINESPMEILEDEGSVLSELSSRTDVEYTSVVGMIDNMERSHRLGFIYELKNKSGGCMLVCNANPEVLDKTKEGRALMHSLLNR